MKNRRHLAAATAALCVVLAGAPARAQWVPTGPLATVLVVQDCTQTGGDVAVSRLDPPTVYLCERVMRLVRRNDPGAEHFYFVHEFGHVALQTSDEAAADCWAARELASAPQGGRYLRAIADHLRRRPDVPSRLYGTPNERAERIRLCAEDARPDAGAIEPPAPRPRRR